VIESKRVLAIVPARAGSKGLPGKNIRPLLGHPLLAWPICAAKASRYVDRVIVSTDSEQYALIANAYGGQTPFLRPPSLAIDVAPSSGAILHALDTLESRGEHYEYFVLLEPTSPLTEGTDIDLALETLSRHRELADSAVGVSELVSTHPAFAVRVDKQGLAAPYAAADFSHLARRQDVEPLYALDGSLYVSAVDAYRRHATFCHGRTLAHCMPRHKSHEIDDLVDFVCVEAIARHFNMPAPTLTTAGKANDRSSP
jgi:CMP-N,N'-diacetyllegionaminic acid synthase